MLMNFVVDAFLNIILNMQVPEFVVLIQQTMMNFLKQIPLPKLPKSGQRGERTVSPVSIMIEQSCSDLLRLESEHDLILRHKLIIDCNLT